MDNIKLRHEILDRKLNESGQYIPPTAMRFLNEAMEEYALKRANFIFSKPLLSAVFIRLMGLPFFIILSLIAAIVLWMKYIKNYIRYGGEALAYTKKMNKKTIADLWHKLENSENKNGC